MSPTEYVYVVFRSQISGWLNLGIGRYLHMLGIHRNEPPRELYKESFEAEEQRDGEWCGYACYKVPLEDVMYVPLYDDDRSWEEDLIDSDRVDAMEVVWRLVPYN